MRKYGLQNALVENSVEELVKSIPTRFGSRAICISNSISKRCLRKR